MKNMDLIFCAKCATLTEDERMFCEKYKEVGARKRPESRDPRMGGQTRRVLQTDERTKEVTQWDTLEPRSCC